MSVPLPGIRGFASLSEKPIARRIVLSPGRDFRTFSCGPGGAVDKLAGDDPMGLRLRPWTCLGIQRGLRPWPWPCGGSPLPRLGDGGTLARDA
ncbi:MAG: hypothetical protein LBP92_07250 [Deltaproteobacteria bacterium]|nr:hypothetical protein [Deltaproteobacteria bacterium]